MYEKKKSFESKSRSKKVNKPPFSPKKCVNFFELEMNALNV